MDSYKRFITISQKRKVRKDILYQVIADDICDIFGAGAEQRLQFKKLINGKDISFVNDISVKEPKVDE